MLGLYQVSVQLHPEVHLNVTVNVARSAEEAERQALGEVQKVEELKSIDEAKEKADLLEIEAVVAEEVIIKAPQE